MVKKVRSEKWSDFILLKKIRNRVCTFHVNYLALRQRPQGVIFIKLAQNK